MIPNNFDPAHVFYSQALVALSNPYSVAFTDVRNSSVLSIQSLKESTNASPLERLKKLNESIKNTHSLVDQLIQSKRDIYECQNAIQAMMNKAPQPSVIDIDDQKEEESAEEEWEIIET